VDRSFGISEHLDLLVTSDKLVNEAQHIKVRKHTQHDIAGHGSKVVFEILLCQALIMRFDLSKGLLSDERGMVSGFIMLLLQNSQGNSLTFIAIHLHSLE